MKELYHSRPFKTRNADQFDLSQVLHLFVNPIEGLTTPFDFDNSIIKGRMGSGKTMYLRANYAYYLYNMVPSLLNREEIILPVLIRLSDYQHIPDPSQIYKAIILRIIQEMVSLKDILLDASCLVRLHKGIQTLPWVLSSKHIMPASAENLARLSADEYIETVSHSFSSSASARPKFFDLSLEYGRQKMLELHGKPNPGIRDVQECFEALLAENGGKLLLLIDEAGALDKSFFRGKESNSFFEILMNQFRTAPYLRTKIAIYPNSYQDILTETRYGDIVMLEETIMTIEGYRSFRKRVISLIENYINSSRSERLAPEMLYDFNPNADYGDCLEQLINGSNGNIRRLIQLLDSAMDTAFQQHGGTDRVSSSHVMETMQKHSRVIEQQHNQLDLDFLNQLLLACRARGTYKFQFPNMSPILNKYTSRSQEFNLISVLELGVGRRSTIYAFDYAFCVAHDVPTHYILNTERIDKERSLKTGQWIGRVAGISGALIKHASIPGKIEGQFDQVMGDKGMIRGDDEKDYFFMQRFVIDEDKLKPLLTGKRVRFFPSMLEQSPIALAIEIL
jgi:hypothetical protein